MSLDFVKGTQHIPESYHPSLATFCENMASHSEQITKKTRKFQIVYAGPTNLYQHSTIDLARGIMTNERKQSALSKARSFKHSKTTSIILYSIYHQCAGKTSLFYMRGVDFTHFNTCCTFKLLCRCFGIVKNDIDSFVSENC